MSEFFIKPAEGKAVRDPRTMKPLNEKGELKPRNSYWLRRFKFGDVVEVNASQQTPEAPAAASVPASLREPSLYEDPADTDGPAKPVRKTKQVTTNE